jgi:ADP-L-glycero-D-manno-heptose 6-epimerase
VAVNLWFYDNPTVSGLFNLGTGRAQPFNDIAVAVVNTMHSLNSQSTSNDEQTLAQLVEQQLIQYIPFPTALIGKYQCHTQADLTALRAAGCNHTFADVNQGVSAYIWQLASK